LLLSRMAHKIVYYLIAAGPFALVFYLCRSYFPGWPTGDVFAAFLYGLAMSFLLGFFMEATMGMIAFWLLEVSSLLFVLMLFTFFFSGHMFPLEFLPDFWKNLIIYTPFPYLAYFPSAVFLGKVEGPALVNGLVILTAWTVGFAVLCRLSMLAGFR